MEIELPEEGSGKLEVRWVSFRVKILALRLIKDREGGDELAIHVLGCAIGLRGTSPADDDRPQQPRVDLFRLVKVRVIHPED